MAGAKVTIPMGRRNLNEDGKYSGGPESIAVMIFGFLEEGEESPENTGSSGESESSGGVQDTNLEDEFEDEDFDNVEKNKAYWESKNKLLEASLFRSSSIETKIRQDTKGALRELKLPIVGCACRRPVADGCRNCLRREICDRLRILGHNCSICKSKWRSSSNFPSGEHTYLEVKDNSNSKKGEVRVVIELNFRAEFEMARASEEYNKLVSRLPEVFVGKAERLRELIKIVCSAAKKCMKDKKMHMAPWRKHKYMQAKWLGTFERATNFAPVQSNGFLVRPPKPRTSMLTSDLIQNLQVLHCSTAVKVL